MNTDVKVKSFSNPYGAVLGLKVISIDCQEDWNHKREESVNDGYQFFMDRNKQIIIV